MKKETLEEAAAEEYFLQEYSWNGKDSLPYKEEDVKSTKENFIAGAKWQAERMYSEEDMEEAFTNGLNRSFDSDFDRWFEQFKK